MEIGDPRVHVSGLITAYKKPLFNARHNDCVKIPAFAGMTAEVGARHAVPGCRATVYVVVHGHGMPFPYAKKIRAETYHPSVIPVFLRPGTAIEEYRHNNAKKTGIQIGRL